MSVDNGWQVASLSSLCEQIYDGPHATPKKTLSGPVFLGIWNLSNGRLDLSETEHLSEDDFVKWTRRVTPEHGDIVFSYETRLGDAAMIPEGLHCCLGRRMGLLRIDRKKAVPRFVLYAYLAPAFQQTIRSRTVQGSTVDRILLTELGNFPVRVPPLGQQETIADILGALDDKIELNRRMNETLEAIARAIFKSWFVDFDPVRAKMEGRKPHGMDERTAALFSDTFEYSPLGKIPKGWTARRVNDVADIIKGRSYASSELSDSDASLVTLKSFRRGGGYRADGLKPFIGQYKPEQVVLPGELVVAFTDVTQSADVIGKPAIVRRDARFRTLIASLDVGIVRPKSDDVSIAFLYCLFRTDDFQAHTYGHATGTTVLHLSKEAIPSFPFVSPTTAIGQAFASIAEPQFAKIDQNEQEANVLAGLRNALLPKLLSGAVRVGSQTADLKA